MWLWQGVLANLLTTLIYLTLGFATLGGYFILNRQRLMRFFGPGENGHGIRIYVSHLEIQPGGAQGREPIRTGYVGPAIIRVELRGALLLADLFSSALLARLPKRTQEWLRMKRLTVVPIEPSIDVCPSTFEEIGGDNLILVGSGVYNVGSHFYLHSQRSRFRFGRRRNGEHVLRMEQADKTVTLPGRSVGRELAIVKRIRDTDRNRVVFICAGLGASASFGAARYLTANWRALQQRYGDEEFDVCLAFPGQSADSDAVTDPLIVPLD